MDKFDKMLKVANPYLKSRHEKGSKQLQRISFAYNTSIVTASREQLMIIKFTTHSF